MSGDASLSAAAGPSVAEVEASQSTLDVIRLPYGEEEPEGEDYIAVSQRVDGGFQFSGLVAIHGDGVVDGSHTSTTDTIGADGPFATAEAAEAAAIEWAAEQGAETLYVLTATESLPEPIVGSSGGHGK